MEKGFKEITLGQTQNCVLAFMIGRDSQLSHSCIVCTIQHNSSRSFVISIDKRGTNTTNLPLLLFMVDISWYMAMVIIFTDHPMLTHLLVVLDSSSVLGSLAHLNGLVIG